MEKSTLGLTKRDGSRATTKTHDIVEAPKILKWQRAEPVEQVNDVSWTRIGWSPRLRGRPADRWDKEIRTIAGFIWQSAVFTTFISTLTRPYPATRLTLL